MFPAEQLEDVPFVNGSIAAGQTVDLLVESMVKENGGTWGTSNDGATTWCRLAVPGGQP